MVISGPLFVDCKTSPSSEALITASSAETIVPRRFRAISVRDTELSSVYDDDVVRFNCDKQLVLLGAAVVGNNIFGSLFAATADLRSRVKGVTEFRNNDVTD